MKSVRGFYHFAGLGSVVGLSNSSGATVETYAYDVYGRVQIRNAQGGLRNTSFVGNPIVFHRKRQTADDTDIILWK